MATSANVLTYTRKSSGDLSSSQYKFVKQASTGRVSVCGAGESAFGVLLNDPSAIDHDALVAIGGVTHVMAGGTVAIGSLVQSDSAGRAVDSAGGVILGEAVSGGSTGSIMSIALKPMAAAGYVYSATATDIQTATVTVTTAQLLAIRAAPQTLVPAPAAGYANVLVSAVLFYDYLSTAYAVDAADNLEIRYTDGSGALIATIETDGFLTLTADAVRYIEPTTAAAIAPVSEAAIVLTCANSEVLTGNSPLKLKVYYRVVPTAF